MALGMFLVVFGFIAFMIPSRRGGGWRFCLQSSDQDLIGSWFPGEAGFDQLSVVPLDFRMCPKRIFFRSALTFRTMPNGSSRRC